MSGGITTNPFCVICGTTRNLEKNHVGGRNHIAWFTMWFCRAHHVQFHAFLRTSGIELEYTTDARVRLIRAVQALSLCEWILHQALLHQETRNETSS
jgi:hypothetical protein